MNEPLTMLVRLGVALGIGLLIGTERERHRQLEEGRDLPAGVRTFSLLGLLGGIAGIIDDVVVIGIVLAATTVIAGLGYVRTADPKPGVTTEVAEIVTVLLGVLAIQTPALAAAGGVAVTTVLIVRSRLHSFVVETLSPDEMHDAVIFLAAALIVLPLLPDRPIDPYNAFVPRSVGELALVVMAVGAAGHIAVRTLGGKYGLPLIGFAGGFVSSPATIGTMGSRSKSGGENECSLAVAGATLSTVATMIVLAVVLSLASFSVLWHVTPSLLMGGIAALAYGGLFTLRAVKTADESSVKPVGRPFDLKTALVFAVGVSLMLLVAAWAQSQFGGRGVFVATGVAGFAHGHLAAYSASNLVANDGISAQTGAVAVLIALSTNTVTKAVVAATVGSRAFALRVVPGLAIVIAAVWAGAFVRGLLG